MKTTHEGKAHNLMFLRLILRVSLTESGIIEDLSLWVSLRKRVSMY